MMPPHMLDRWRGTLQRGQYVAVHSDRARLSARRIAIRGDKTFLEVEADSGVVKKR
jgi:hypothetical protein